MLVRDEADVIAENLAATLEWVDTVAILDTGSSDGTWEIIQAIAAREKRLRIVERRPLIFNQSYRAYLFDRMRKEYAGGDWVVKLDADEFFHIPPPAFVAECVRKYETCIFLQWYYFRLTSIEVREYESGVIDVAADRNRPIANRRRYFKCPSYSEPRLFRYRVQMKWSETNFAPYHAGVIAKNRIPIRHYPHRDPWQMRDRYLLRARMKGLSMSDSSHWATSNWQQDVILLDEAGGNAREHSSHAGLNAAPNHTSGPLYFWEHGESLPDLAYRTHLPSVAGRIAQRIFHACGLSIADRLRGEFTPHSDRQWPPDNMQSAWGDDI